MICPPAAKAQHSPTVMMPWTWTMRSSLATPKRSQDAWQPCRPAASRGRGGARRAAAGAARPPSRGEELADSQAEFGGVQDTVMVQVEPAERAFGFLGAGPVDRGELLVFGRVQDPVAVEVRHFDERGRGGADGGFETGPVLDGAAQARGELIR